MEERRFHDDDIYCSDPDCSYCRDLRMAEEQWKRTQAEARNRGRESMTRSNART
jgi:hypothetical protein